MDPWYWPHILSNLLSWSIEVKTSCRDKSRNGVNTLGPLCLRQCFQLFFFNLGKPSFKTTEFSAQGIDFLSRVISKAKLKTSCRDIRSPYHGSIVPLAMFEICPLGGATCISPKFDRNVAKLEKFNKGGGWVSAQLKKFYKGGGGCLLGMPMRMREFAVHADHAHIRKYADENLIHIIHK